MSESFEVHAAVVPLEVQRAVAAAELAGLARMVAYVNVPGLQAMRRRLKEPELVAICRLGPIAEVRANLLDLVCRVLEARGVAPLAYYQGAGDAYPDVPDDVGGGE